MTLITGLFMGIINAVLELRIVKKSPFLTKLFAANTMWGMLFSLVLAVVLGTWLFAANGIVIMLAWLTSTALTQTAHEARAAKEKRPMLFQQVEAWKSILKVVLFPLYVVRWIFRLPYNLKNKRSIFA